MRSSLAILAALLLSLNQTAQAKVIDDFDDNKVKGWEKFDFGTGNGYFKEKGGQFTIGMHKPTGQQFSLRPPTRPKNSPSPMASRWSFGWILRPTSPMPSQCCRSSPDTPVSKLSGYSWPRTKTTFFWPRD